MGWWDEVTTKAGDFFIQPQTFGGLMPAPTDPAQRQAMIAQGLLSLGSNLTNAGRQGYKGFSAIGQGIQGMHQQGQEAGMQKLQMGLLGGKLQEAQRTAKRRSELEKMHSDPKFIAELGPHAAYFKYMPEDQQAALISKMMLSRQEREDSLKLYDQTMGGGGGGTPRVPTGGMPTPAGGDEITRTAGLESPTGAPNAAGSGATGYLQWMPHTAYSIARQTPWGRGLSQEQVMAAITDEVKQTGGQGPGPKEREMKGIYDATSNGALSSAGLPTSASNRYILHRYGPAAGVELLRADPNMPLGQWVQSVKWDNGASPQAVISQNRLDPNMSVGEHRAQLTQMMAPGGVTRPPSRTVPQAPQEDAGAPSPVQQVQATVPPQGAPQAPAGPPQAVQIDPGIPQRVHANARLLAGSGKLKEALDMLKPYMGPEAANKDVIFDRKTQQFIINPLAVQAKTEIARAGAAPAPETEALKLNAKDASELASATQAAALKSRSAKANLQQLGGLLEGMDTGRFKETTTDIKRMAKGVGIDLTAMGIKDDVPAAEAARALVNQLALQMRDPSTGAGMPGAMSDKDREFLVQMIPTLETTPAGRKLMLGYMGKIHDHNIALAKVATEYRRGPNWAKDPQGIVTAMQEFSDKNPIFRQEDIDAVTQARGATPVPTAPGPEPQAPGGQQMPTVTGPDEYLKLPAGTQYRDPQGNVRTKR